MRMQSDASLKPIHEGDILTGEVIGVSEDTVTLDLGSFTDGIIRLEDASDDPNFTFNEIQVGQTISATVIRRDDGEGHILLSMKEAAAVLGWERLEQLLKDQSNITVKISEAVKSGVVAYVEGIRGFIPASKLALEYVENPEDWVGKEIEVRVITADPEDKKLVLSAKEILREKEAEERKQRVSNVEVGLVTEGTVESLMRVRCVCPSLQRSDRTRTCIPDLPAANQAPGCRAQRRADRQSQGHRHQRRQDQSEHEGS